MFDLYNRKISQGVGVDNSGFSLCIEPRLDLCAVNSSTFKVSDGTFGEFHDLKLRSLVVVGKASEKVVTVWPDGTVEIGPGFTAEGAARETAMQFWAMVGGNVREYSVTNSEPTSIVDLSK